RRSSDLGEPPVGHRSFLVLYVDIEPDVRIGPFHLRDDTTHLDGLRVVVLVGKRGRGEGRRCAQPPKGGKEAGEAYSHGDSFHPNSSQLKPNHTLMTTFPMK